MQVWPKSRDKILKAAEYIVCHEGVSALAINHLAQKASVSKPLIYKYFQNINGVVAALWDLSGVDDLVKLPNGNVGAAELIKKARQLAANPLAVALLMSENGCGPSNIAYRRANEEEARLALMLAGVCFLLARANRQRGWVGLSLSSPNDLAIFEKAVLDMFHGGGDHGS